MAKHPFIKFWTGDWLRDTQLLSNEAKGFWIDLICHLHESVITGVITLDITELCRISKESHHNTEGLMNELIRRNICDVEREADGRYRITSRRMLKEAAKSEKASIAGTKGMKSRYSKKEENVITNVITKTITNSGIGIGNSNDSIKEGGMGETIKDADVKKYEGYTLNSVLSLEDCLGVYLYTETCKEQRNILVANRKQFTVKAQNSDKDEVNIKLLERWGQAFNIHLKKRGDMQARTLSAWVNHAFNWICKQDLTKQPENLYEQSTNTNGTQQGANSAAGSTPASAGFIPRPTGSH